MIRVVLADDHTIVRQGLRAILSSDSSIEVVGEASNGLEAIRLASEVIPDVVVLDLKMPELDGVEACERLVGLLPESRILVLTQVDATEYLVRLLEAGAAGYVLKDCALQDLVRAIHVVNDGDVYLSQRMLTQLVRRMFTGAQRPLQSPLQRLSPREVQVLRHIAEGLTNQQIADQLAVSVKTVQAHRSNLMEKLDLHRRADLVRFAFQNGLVAQ